MKKDSTEKDKKKVNVIGADGDGGVGANPKIPFFNSSLLENVDIINVNIEGLNRSRDQFFTKFSSYSKDQ